MYFQIPLTLLILNCIQCNGQTSIEGNWLTTNTRIANNRLFEFKNDSVKSEILSDWRTYKIIGKKLFIYCMDHTMNRNTYTSIYEIALLSKDSLIISPINDVALKEGITFNRWREKPAPIKFFRRELTFQNINFDSISYSSKQGPFYLQTYYSPGQEVSVTLQASGVVRYDFKTFDTVNSDIHKNRKKIKWSDNEKHSEHLVGKLSPENILEFTDLLDKSNVHNIDIEKDFGKYKNRLHGNPSVLTVYRNGQKIYEQRSIDYPWTLLPVISFLRDIPNIFTRN